MNVLYYNNLIVLEKFGQTHSNEFRCKTIDVNLVLNILSIEGKKIIYEKYKNWFAFDWK